MAAFMTHPSVRIKGTENNFEPVLCVHPKCAHRPPHMHCPFCVKTETYPDPVILKAHYRVKHVDKGLDFAGLKILRCCDHCDIVGTIKGEKKFKGPHWHCYKCKNGFNRRDEAIKHYRTHFRNPQTTFQIQVAQEVNVMLNNINSTESAEAIDNIGDHNDFGMHGALGEGYYSESYVNQKTDSSAQVAANETVDATDAQTIMIIQDRESQEYKESLLLQAEQVSYDELLSQKCHLERHVENLEANLKLTEAMRTENEKLKQQNSVLLTKVQELTDELSSLREVSGEKHAAKVNELLDNLTTELQRKAKEILREQMHRVEAEVKILSENSIAAKTQNTTAHTHETDVASDNSEETTPHLMRTDVVGPKPKRTRTHKS